MKNKDKFLEINRRGTVDVECEEKFEINTNLNSAFQYERENVSSCKIDSTQQPTDCQPTIENSFLWKFFLPIKLFCLRKKLLTRRNRIIEPIFWKAFANVKKHVSYIRNLLVKSLTTVSNCFLHLKSCSSCWSQKCLVFDSRQWRPLLVFVSL